VRAWGEGWWDLNTRIGDEIGDIIGAPKNTISIHPNISIAHGVLLTAFNYDGPRNKVIIEGGIFPSEYYMLRGMLPPHIEIVTIPSENGISVDPQQIIDAIDDKTLMVHVSHVLFRSAYILDVKPIIERAHQKGAFTVLSGFHATGIVPTDVTALDCDFYLSGVLKWMCGGPGGCFLYARPDHLKTFKPKFTGWMAHKHPFDFEIADIDMRDDAFRFLNGTPSVPNLHAIRPGIVIISQVGVDNIRQKSLAQTELICKLADNMGYEVNSPRNPSERGGTVTVNPPHAYEVSRELLARDIVIDYRPQAGIRISPHFYNSDDEVRACMAAIKDIIDTGTWEKHAQQKAFIT
jgi:kynureninase